jgi:HD-like signal output (HDOD) protein
MYDTVILEYQGRFGKGRTLDDIVAWVENIPPLPDATNRALRLVDDPNSTPHEIAAVLARDPAIIAAVMRAANSASLGRSTAVGTAEEAVLVVGLGALKSFLLGMALKRWNKNVGEIERLVWDKSLGTSAAAYVLATFLGKSYQEAARLAGLLHNLGQIVMLSHPDIRHDYPNVLEVVRQKQISFTEAEREVIGYSYPLVGAMVARKWKLPYSLCTTILRHAEVYDGIDSPQAEQDVLVGVASTLSMCAGLGCPVGHPLACDSQLPAARALGFTEDDFNNYRSILAKQVLALHATESNVFR